MKRVVCLLFLLSAGLGEADVSKETISQIERMSWMTEHYPPFNYLDEQEGKLKGITVDILMEMFKKVGVGLRRRDLTVFPWARSYDGLLQRPQTALFSP